MKAYPDRLYLARKIGEHPNASVSMNRHDPKGAMLLSWETEGGDPVSGYIGKRLARLLARRINQALDAE